LALKHGGSFSFEGTKLKPGEVHSGSGAAVNQKNILKNQPEDASGSKHAYHRHAGVRYSLRDLHKRQSKHAGSQKNECHIHHSGDQPLMHRRRPWNDFIIMVNARLFRLQLDIVKARQQIHLLAPQGWPCDWLNLDRLNFLFL